jgi:hypothetical protein
VAAALSVLVVHRLTQAAGVFDMVGIVPLLMLAAGKRYAEDEYGDWRDRRKGQKITDALYGTDEALNPLGLASDMAGPRIGPPSIMQGGMLEGQSPSQRDAFLKIAQSDPDLANRLALEQSSYDMPQAPMNPVQLAAIDKSRSGIRVDDARIGLLEAQTAGAGADATWKNVTADDQGQAWGYHVEEGVYKAMPQAEMRAKYKTVESYDQNGNPVKELVRMGKNEQGESIVAERIKATTGEKKLGLPESVAISNAELALADLKTVREKYFNEDGTLNRMNVATGAVGQGLWFTEGREAAQAIRRSIEIMLRARTGAAAPDAEVVNYLNMFRPSFGDSDASAEAKMRNLEQFQHRILDLLQRGYAPNSKELLDRSIEPEGWTPPGGETEATTTGEDAAPEVFTDDENVSRRFNDQTGFWEHRSAAGKWIPQTGFLK